jgi:hypothetical protein
MKSTVSTLLFSLVMLLGQAQNFDYKIHLEPIAIDGLDGTHSYAFATYNNEWLIVGGRKDGLHARQPFNAFPASFNNTSLMVINIDNQAVYSDDLNALSTNIKEQLQSTNMCFHQVEDTLYIAGGYAFSETAQDHITFPYLTTIIVSQTINAIKTGGDVSAYIKQVANVDMAVTGGHLAHLDNKLILVGGHKFDGRYNPMGMNTYVQTYTDGITSFKVNNSGQTPVISGINKTTDAAHLHRRDYNLMPQVFCDGSFGYMISSGVFQVNADLPFLYPVEIKSSGHTAIPSFNQYLSNYHSAAVSIYDSSANVTHSLFFGGISQYFYSNGSLQQDNNVPFVNTISRVSRDANDLLTEYKQDEEMPGLMGASAEFIMNEYIASIEDEIVVVGNQTTDSLNIGHIYGGIKSTQSNPFTNNNTAVTSASPTIYKVWLIKEEAPAGFENKIISEHHFDASLYPNPSKGDVFTKLNTPFAGDATVLITDINGRLIKNLTINDLKEGANDVKIIDKGQLEAGVYHFTFSFEGVYHDTASVVIP